MLRKQGLDLGHERGFRLTDEGQGGAFLVAAGRAPNSMHVVLRRGREVEVEDVTDAAEVNPARHAVLAIRVANLRAEGERERWRRGRREREEEEGTFTFAWIDWSLSFCPFRL